MSSLAPTYSPQSLSFVKGQGSWLYDDGARAYLDFASGIAVTSLGHNHPVLTRALQAQLGNLIHVSNLFGIPGQQRLADRLTQNSFADAVFFCNSGAEAMEAAIKFARRYHWHQGAPERFEVISFGGGFHGRTLATIAAGGSDKYLKGFGPKVAGFVQVPFEDLAAAEAAIGPQTAALLIEPVQGEGGIRPNRREFMQGARALAHARDLLLILDEVQTGVGRTGKFWAYEHFGTPPDILASAKGLGAGLPIGATLMTQAVADTLAPGVHGSTFGGNPLAMAAGTVVMDTIDRPGFLTEVAEKGSYLSQGLEQLAQGNNCLLAGTRGLGLMQSVQLYPDGSVAELAAAAQNQGLLTVPASDQTLRLLPPLIVSGEEIDQALDKLSTALRSL